MVYQYDHISLFSGSQVAEVSVLPSVCMLLPQCVSGSLFKTMSIGRCFIDIRINR